MSDSVAQICSITGISPEQATKLLEMSNNDLDAAINLFFEHGAEFSEQPKPQTQPEYTYKPQVEEDTKIPIQHPEEKNSEDDKDDGDGHEKGIEEIMKIAQEEHGAKSFSEIGAQEEEKWVGTAHKVGAKGATSEKIHTDSKQDKRRIIKFYKDCFTLDDGPPRKFVDPANKEFLEAIRDGRYPREIMPKHGPEVEVELIDLKNEEWKPAPKDKNYFEGKGQSMSDKTSTSGSSHSVAKELVLDSTKPSGSIKIRFLDGTQKVVKANHDHNVGDLRSHLEAIHPCGKPFQLNVTSPPQALTNMNITLKEAGVIGAAVVQTL